MDNLIQIITYELGENFFNHLIFHYGIVFVLFCVTPVLVTSDLIYAVSTAKSLGERIRSHKLRKSVDKMLRYWGLQILAAIVGSIGLLFPDYYNLPYLSILMTLVVAIIEGKSLWEHFKRRKDHLSKVPETIQDLINLVGSEDDLKDIVKSVLRKKLGQDLGVKE